MTKTFTTINTDNPRAFLPHNEATPKTRVVSIDIDAVMDNKCTERFGHIARTFVCPMMSFGPHIETNGLRVAIFADQLLISNCTIEPLVENLLALLAGEKIITDLIVSANKDGVTLIVDNLADYLIALADTVLPRIPNSVTSHITNYKSINDLTWIAPYLMNANAHRIYTGFKLTG